MTKIYSPLDTSILLYYIIMVPTQNNKFTSIHIVDPIRMSNPLNNVQLGKFVMALRPQVDFPF